MKPQLIKVKIIENRSGLPQLGAIQLVDKRYGDQWIALGLAEEVKEEPKKKKKQKSEE